ncbi:TPA: hypothetical protein RI785_002410 [Vibrio cholerae]|nr:hypothetical protein [Vibrio cholerae]
MIILYRFIAFSFDLLFVISLSLAFDLFITFSGLDKDAFDYFLIFSLFVNNYILEISGYSSLGKRLFKLKTICLKNNEYESFLIKLSIFILIPIFISYVVGIITYTTGIDSTVNYVIIYSTVLTTGFIITFMKGSVSPIDHITKTRVVFNHLRIENGDFKIKFLLALLIIIFTLTIYQATRFIRSDIIKIFKFEDVVNFKREFYHFPYRKLYEDNVIFLKHNRNISGKYKDYTITSCKSLINYDYFRVYYSDIYDWSFFDGDCLVVNVMVDLDQILVERFSEYIYRLILGHPSYIYENKRAVNINYELNGRIARFKLQKSIIKTDVGFIVSELRLNFELTLSY